MDLVPKESRPFIGSSTNNTVMELIVGHNGLERLGIGGTSTPGDGRQGPAGQDGQRPGPPGQLDQFRDRADTNSGASLGDEKQEQGIPFNGGQDRGQPGNDPGPIGNNVQPPGAGGGGGSFGGNEKASIIRLFSNNNLSDQIIWLFPLAVFGFIAASIREKLKRPFDNERKLALAMWSMWLLPEFIYFSYTKGLFHPYYLTMLAPPISALVGIGAVEMWQLYKEGGWKSWILPAAFIVNGLVQILILSYYSTITTAKILMITTSVFCFGASALLAVLNMAKNMNEKFKKIALGSALIGLLTAPTIWSSTTMFYGMSGTFPSAGLGLISDNGMNNFDNQSSTKLIQFLQAHKSNEKYLVAVSSAMNNASEIIIKTGESVMTLGGFSGSDKILTLDEFKKLVSLGEIRYVIVSGQGGAGNNEIMNWVKENGKAVSESEWNDSQRDNGFNRRNSIELYELTKY